MTNSNGHIFISYAHEDRGKVAVLAGMFEAEGWSVWWDRNNLPAGKTFHQAIDQAIQDAACVLVLWSRASVDSPWVVDEANEAKKLDKFLPVLLDSERPPFGFRSYHCVDLSHWNTKDRHSSYERLKSELKNSYKIKTVATKEPSERAGHIEVDRKKKTRTFEQPKEVPKQKNNKPEVFPVKIQTLIDTFTNPTVKPVKRLAAGDQLEKIGDPRRGVGLDAEGLPDIDWVEIKGGEFLYGEEKFTMEIDSFYIARYPITYAQYEAFINADGYEDNRWWQGLSKLIWNPNKPGWPRLNRPRGYVSWYEAIDFCNWLSIKLGYKVSLPTEHQWERTARWTDGREYPWGDYYKSGYANTNELSTKAGSHYLKQTSTVGMYSFASSPEGILDLSGNIWEWCLNEFDNPCKTSTNNQNNRVLRGGSWIYNPNYARSSYRGRFNPNGRNNYVGFRVVCSSAITR